MQSNSRWLYCTCMNRKRALRVPGEILIHENHNMFPTVIHCAACAKACSHPLLQKSLAICYTALRASASVYLIFIGRWRSSVVYSRIPVRKLTVAKWKHWNTSTLTYVFGIQRETILRLFQDSLQSLLKLAIQKKDHPACASIEASGTLWSEIVTKKPESTVQETLMSKSVNRWVIKENLHRHKEVLTAILEAHLRHSPNHRRNGYLL